MLEGLAISVSFHQDQALGSPEEFVIRGGRDSKAQASGITLGKIGGFYVRKG